MAEMDTIELDIIGTDMAGMDTIELDMIETGIIFVLYRYAAGHLRWVARIVAGVMRCSSRYGYRLFL
jgi:hypothetical protein